MASIQTSTTQYSSEEIKQRKDFKKKWNFLLFLSVFQLLLNSCLSFSFFSLSVLSFYCTAEWFFSRLGEAITLRSHYLFLRIFPFIRQCLLVYIINKLWVNSPWGQLINVISCSEVIFLFAHFPFISIFLLYIFFIFFFKFHWLSVLVIYYYYHK